MAAAPCSAVGVGVGNERLERGRRRGDESVALLSPPLLPGKDAEEREEGVVVGWAAARPALPWQDDRENDGDMRRHWYTVDRAVLH